MFPEKIIHRPPGYGGLAGPRREINDLLQRCQLRRRTGGSIKHVNHLPVGSTGLQAVKKLKADVPVERELSELGC